MNDAERLRELRELFLSAPIPTSTLIVALLVGLALLGLVLWLVRRRALREEYTPIWLATAGDQDHAGGAGASPRRIIFKHILPNSLGTIVVSTTLLMGAGILTEAALSFVGFGIQPPNVSLGAVVSDYARSFHARPHLFVFPGLFIIGIVLCLQFIGDGLRDAFDPRQKRIPRFKDLERKAAEQERRSTDVAVSNQAPGGGANT